MYHKPSKSESLRRSAPTTMIGSSDFENNSVSETEAEVEVTAVTFNHAHLHSSLEDPYQLLLNSMK